MSNSSCDGISNDDAATDLRTKKSIRFDADADADADADDDNDNVPHAIAEKDTATTNVDSSCGKTRSAKKNGRRKRSRTKLQPSSDSGATPVGFVLPIELGDEISDVLHHFRNQRCPNPLLLFNNGIYGSNRDRDSSRITTTTRHCRGHRSQTNGKATLVVSHRGYFSDVRYATTNAGLPSIEATYLFDRVLTLLFRVSILIMPSNNSINNDGDHRCISKRNDCSGIEHGNNNEIRYTTSVAHIDESTGGLCSVRDNYRLLVDSEYTTLLKEQLRTVCESLNNNNNNKAKNPKLSSSPSSLFAVLSRLLLLLNDLQTQELHKTTPRVRPIMASPLRLRSRSRLRSRLRSRSSCCLEPPGAAAAGNGSAFASASASASTTAADAAVDLGILLLRCAAVGKHRDVFVHPLPPPSPHSWFSFAVPRDDDGGWCLAERVWKATEFCNRHRDSNRDSNRNRKRRHPTNANGNGNGNGNGLQQQQQQQQKQQVEQELVGFLRSLPWVERGTVTAVENSDATRSKGGGSGGIQIRIRLDLERAASEPEREETAAPGIGSYTCDYGYGESYSGSGSGGSGDESYAPRFARLCRRHGSLTAYHGTHADHAWSILNNGFWNMSSERGGGGGGKFVKNGAMLGSGIYLSTSRKVATFFATTSDNNASKKKSESFARAFRHESLHNLLRGLGRAPISSSAADYSKADADADSKAAAADAAAAAAPNGKQTNREEADFHQLYDVSCFPVFEATIIRPPDSTGVGHDADAPKDYQPTRRDGKYYVVPDGRDIRITKLHLTFELARKRRRGGYGVLLPSYSHLSRCWSDHPILVVGTTIGVLLISLLYHHHQTTKKHAEDAAYV